MIESRGHISSAPAASQRRGRLLVRRAWGLLVLASLLNLAPAWADGPDEDYLQVYNQIQQGDELVAAGKADLARAKYVQAMTALSSFKTNYPYWNKQLVALRLNSLTEKITALSEKPRAVAPDAPASNSGAQSGSKATASLSATQIRLLEPGAEPRKALRLHPTAGDKQSLALTIKMAIESKVGEMATPAMKLPAIKMNLASTIKSVADNGDITFDMVLGDISIGDEPDAAPAAAEALKAALGGVKGLSGSGTTTSRGVSAGAELKAPPDANPQARQILDQMKEFYAQLAEPFPEEAIGPGAKWEVKTPLKTQGMTLNQTATYELVSIDGDSLTTKSTIVQEAANQKIQSPAMPGMKVDLTRMTGKGTGERNVDLGKLLPIAGTGKSHTESDMSMTMGGQKQAMSMKMDMDIRFAAK